jgi:hypothetical protein
MTDLVDEVRRSVADAHGLPEQAASLLTGDTLAELEASAGQLAELLTARQADPEPEESEPETMADVVTRSVVEKRQRQAALIASLHPEPEPPRDEGGKFATKPTRSGGLGCGARRPVPQPKNPVQEHDEIVLQVAHLSSLGCSQF